MVSLRIAVADDEQDMRDYLKAVLERLGHTVLGPVENGSELVALCRQESPDLIITDVRMPELDGYEATRLIRKKNMDQPVIIALTASSMKGDYEKCIEAGMDDYLSKPIKKEDLIKTIQKWESKILD